MLAGAGRKPGLVEVVVEDDEMELRREVLEGVRRTRPVVAVGVVAVVLFEGVPGAGAGTGTGMGTGGGDEVGKGKAAGSRTEGVRGREEEEAGRGSGTVEDDEWALSTTGGAAACDDVRRGEKLRARERETGESARVWV